MKFFLNPLAPSRPLHSKKFQTMLILAFEAKSALSHKSETKIVKITHSGMGRTFEFWCHGRNPKIYYWIFLVVYLLLIVFLFLPKIIALISHWNHSYFFERLFFSKISGKYVLLLFLIVYSWGGSQWDYYNVMFR